MHKEIFVKEQTNLLPLVTKFKKDFGLVGGTAIALHIGHRQSIDFDLFSVNEFNTLKVRNTIVKNSKIIDKVYKDEKGQFTCFVKKVQFTFFYYPFPITFSENFEKVISIPDLLTLAAMKAYALGRRAKWKDYVDLYFILSQYHTLKEITKKGREIFSGEFNERIFREQLGYFQDIDYREEVIFLPGFEVSEKKIKKSLVEWSVQ